MTHTKTGIGIRLAERLRKRVKLLNGRNGQEPPIELPGVHSTKEFLQILKRECACVNRNSHEFSLVVFHARNGDNSNGLASRLASLLVHRVRATDQVGWLDEKRIGVSLPFTDDTGARTLAEDVLQALPASRYSPRWTVYNYPTNWWTQCEDDPEPSRADGQAGTDTPPLKDPSPSHRVYSNAIAEVNTTTLEGGNGSSAGNGSHARTLTLEAVPAGAVQRIEPLITRPIPTWKRRMDIVGSLAALVLFSPLFLVVSIVIKLLSPGPVFFKQKRVGYLGKTFTFLKFRTMKANADTSSHRQYVKELIKSGGNNGNGKPMTKLDRDARIIPMGKFLRKTCIDELPQLINVFQGEMSLVGPRPCLPYEAREYLLWNTERFNTIPGMTGLWQVEGKNKLTFDEMIRLDITYARRRSFWLDLRIILMTLPAIVAQIKESVSRRKTKN